MNERIKELALQCGAWHQVYDQKLLKINEYFNYEKFAELIVRECVNEVEGLQIYKYTFSWDIDQHWNRAIAHTTLHLKEHFGVEG